jgi:hypothetical protein
MTQPIDPVSSPDAYRRFLLAEDQPTLVGYDQERGPESYDLVFRLIAGHDRVHLDQARRALDQIRGR